MMPTFSYTEITTHSGNTQIYIFQKKKKHQRTYKKHLKQQKLLGAILIVISIVGFIIMPEDCGGCLLAGLLGIARVLCD